MAGEKHSYQADRGRARYISRHRDERSAEAGMKATHALMNTEESDIPYYKARCLVDLYGMPRTRLGEGRTRIRRCLQVKSVAAIVNQLSNQALIIAWAHHTSLVLSVILLVSRRVYVDEANRTSMVRKPVSRRVQVRHILCLRLTLLSRGGKPWRRGQQRFRFPDNLYFETSPHLRRSAKVRRRYVFILFIHGLQHTLDHETGY